MSAATAAAPPGAPSCCRVLTSSAGFRKNQYGTLATPTASASASASDDTTPSICRATRSLTPKNKAPAGTPTTSGATTPAYGFSSAALVSCRIPGRCSRVLTVSMGWSTMSLTRRCAAPPAKPLIKSFCCAAAVAAVDTAAGATFADAAVEMKAGSRSDEMPSVRRVSAGDRGAARGRCCVPTAVAPLWSALARATGVSAPAPRAQRSRQSVKACIVPRRSPDPTGNNNL
mmetsp:Transcript_18567/g.62648  ORF Transcript_18567/g.62648 Transcript_18567/m.62648 type:complete len:230 (-) Transcript_18567:140-829(-)